MQVVAVDPRTDRLWARLVDTQRSSVFHSPAWIRVLTESYGWDARAYVVVDGSDEPLAGIPFCKVFDAMGERVSILPFSDYCDPLVSDPRHLTWLLARLQTEGDCIIFHCLDNCLPAEDGHGTMIKRARWHGIDMQPDMDTIWQRFDHTAKGNVKKAQRDGVTVRYAETEEDLRTFYSMHLRVRKYKYHLLAQPYRFFQVLWKEMIQQGQGVVMLAYWQDQVIAGGLFLEWKDTLYYKFNTSVPDHLCHRPNDLLIWEALCYGKARGYGELDFGRTDWGHEELARYKKKFGAEEKIISLFRYGCDWTAKEQVKEIRTLLPQLTVLMTDQAVPDSVTEQAGNLLYGLFV